MQVVRAEVRITKLPGACPATLSAAMDEDVALIKCCSCVRRPFDSASWARQVEPPSTRNPTFGSCRPILNLAVPCSASSVGFLSQFPRRTSEALPSSVLVFLSRFQPSTMKGLATEGAVFVTGLIASLSRCLHADWLELGILTSGSTRPSLLAGCLVLQRREAQTHVCL